MEHAQSQQSPLPQRRRGSIHLTSAGLASQNGDGKKPETQGLSPTPPGEPKRVLLVHSAALTRLGLVNFLHRGASFRVCAETDNACEARSLFLLHRPDVVVVGLTLKAGDGVELLKDLRKLDPAVSTLVLTTRDDPMSVQRAFRAGATGYVVTRDQPEEILEALERVAAGERFASESILGSVLDHLANGALAPATDKLKRLSDRELQVFRGIAAGHGVTQLARELNLSVKTVETYQTQVRGKLQLRSSAELHDWASEWARRRMGHR